ncbi:MAG: hypothetical protein OEV42_05910 [Deltaproteobacteria bacterium]|nr:hypothetical protein [Deltaproteobacteria bacterium]
MMKIKCLWIFLHIFAAAMPFFSFNNTPYIENRNIVEWPVELNGLPLKRLELSHVEKSFGNDFPGEIARFTDGSREIIIRWIKKESRKLHPAADCLKGAGYRVSHLPLRNEGDGRYWGCVKAEMNGKKIRVCEIIYDESGNSWSDTSSWYWSALFGKSNGPWWALTVAEEV